MKYIIFTLLLASLFACTEPAITEIPEGELKIDVSTRRSVKLSEEFNLAKIIQLETLEECLLGEIVAMEIVGDYIFLLSGGRANGLFVFNEEGKFIRKILTKGEGPGNYGYIQNFSISDGMIYLLDSDLRKVFVCDFEGRNLAEWKNKLFGLDLFVNKDYTITYAGNALNGNIQKKLIFLNEYGEISDTKIPISLDQAEFMNITPEKVFTELSNEIGFLEPFGKGLYSITSDDIKFRYKFEFGRQQVEEEYYGRDFSNVAEFLTELRKKDFAFLFSDYSESEKHLFFSFEYNGAGNRIHYIYDKENNSETVVANYIDDLYLGNTRLTTSEFLPIGISGNQFLYTVYPYDLVEKEINDSLKINVNFDDNPIIYVLDKQ